MSVWRSTVELMPSRDFPRCVQTLHWLLTDIWRVCSASRQVTATESSASPKCVESRLRAWQSLRRSSCFACMFAAALLLISMSPSRELQL